MTPYETYGLIQEYYEQQETIAGAWYMSGVSDALVGQLPQWKDDAYLAGYVAGIKKLPSDSAGRIQYGASNDRAPAEIDEPF